MLQVIKLRFVLLYTLCNRSKYSLESPVVECTRQGFILTKSRSFTQLLSDDFSAVVTTNPDLD